MNKYDNMMPAEFAEYFHNLTRRTESFDKAQAEYDAALLACKPEAPDVDLMRQVGAK
jgi:hypothetical protein